MSWTKQPLNRCFSCWYTWYPRGHKFSKACPHCGSAKVIPGSFFGELFFLVIFIPAKLLAESLKLSCALIAFVVPPLSRQMKSLARDGSPRASALVAYVTTRLKSVAGPIGSSSIAAFRWISSVRDDFGQKQGFATIPFVCKLIVIAIALASAIVLVVRMDG